MSIFLGLSKRYCKALETFDPMRDEWFLRIADPWPSRIQDGKPPWYRLVLIGLIVGGPPCFFSAIPYTTFGGRMLGSGGIVADIGIYSIGFYLASALVLIPIMRRVLGDLLNEIVLRGIAESGLRAFNPLSSHKGRLLGWLEWPSRVEGRRGQFWYLICVAINLFGYYVFLSDGKPTWHTSPAEPGTFFHLLRIGNEQPNLAGVWGFLVFNPIAGYLGVLMARLIIVFACQCVEVSRCEKLSITPTHPDGTGGLLPIGQVALVFTFFTFIVGICIAGGTTNELIVNAVFHPEGPHAGTNLLIQYIFLALYLAIGPLLFFLPLVPLRTPMASAKRCYLLAMNDLRVIAERRHQSELRDKDFNPDSLQGLEALNDLIHSGSAMSVWPFDKKTFLRYASLFISPTIPLLGSQLPSIVAWLKTCLGFF